jgi:hypothetical protein
LRQESEPLHLRQPVLLGDFAVPEDNLARIARAERQLAPDLGGLEPLHAPLDQEAVDLVVHLAPDDGDVGKRRVGDPHLVPIEDPTVALLHRPGLHPARVRAEVGLGEAEAADELGLLELREKPVLLRLAPEGVDRVHHEATLDGGEAADARVAPLQLLHAEAVGDAVHAGAAVALDRGAQEAHVGDLGDQ